MVTSIERNSINDACIWRKKKAFLYNQELSYYMILSLSLSLSLSLMSILFSWWYNLSCGTLICKCYSLKSSMIIRHTCIFFSFFLFFFQHTFLCFQFGLISMVQYVCKPFEVKERVQNSSIFFFFILFKKNELPRIQSKIKYMDKQLI